jgi:hypothetical protein
MQLYEPYSAQTGSLTDSLPHTYSHHAGLFTKVRQNFAQEPSMKSVEHKYKGLIENPAILIEKKTYQH